MSPTATSSVGALSPWARRALYAIGAWTALGGVLALVDPRGHAATFLGAPEIVDAPAAIVLIRIGYAQLLAWGAGYVLAARSPAAARPILIAGTIGKSLYALVTMIAFARGAGTRALLATGIGDLLMAIFFVHLLRHGRSDSSPARAT